MKKDSTIYIAGHRGMVGSAIERILAQSGYDAVVSASSAALDLRDPHAVRVFFEAEQPAYVFLAAGRVGAIQANIANPARYFYDNLMIQTNVIHQAHLSGVRKLLVLGSSCIYPRECPQPMKEEYLLTGVPEPTNEGYALSKIAALKQAEYYRRQYGLNAISMMPPNLYGTNDSFDLAKAHVLSSLVRRFVDACDDDVREVMLWGTGAARREFMHVDDAAAAALFLMDRYDEAAFVNVGWGTDVSIRELAEMVAARVGFDGAIRWDTSKSDGMLRKCLDVTRMRALGFEPAISLEQGVEMTIAEYRKLKREGAVF